jgi:hypothetical protein
MSKFQERKRELLLVSDLNRSVLQLEIGQWQLQAERWQKRMGAANVVLRVVNPLARLFVARKTGGVVRSLWQLITRRK